jgi:enoyl-CoA hydratase
MPKLGFPSSSRPDAHLPQLHYTFARCPGCPRYGGIANVSDELLYELRDGIARVIFNRPEARNALTFAMYERLAEICATVEEDRSVKAMLVTGAGGKAFAAGTDISEFQAFKTAEDALAYEARIERVLAALERSRVPTIAAIAGACTGGGAGIAACCDLRIGAANARFGFPIARTLGNCLSVANYARLAALVGPARVKDIIFTARLLEAREALAIGLLNEVVAEAGALLPRAEELARLVASHAPLTLKATKEALLRIRARIPPGEGDDLIVLCYTSSDFREGMRAFLEKRAPDWRGK